MGLRGLLVDLLADAGEGRSVDLEQLSETIA
jgi:hypothetical protein